MSIKELQEAYSTDNYIILFKVKNEWGKLYREPSFNKHYSKYKAIHKKHERILDAYLKTGNFTILGLYKNEDFIKDYDENREYSLTSDNPQKAQS